MSDLVERLRTRARTYNTGSPVNPAAIGTLGYYGDRDASLDRDAAARIEELEAALDPFSVFADFDATGTAYEGQGDDAAILFDHKTGRQVTIGDLRAARRALEQEGGDDKEG